MIGYYVYIAKNMFKNCYNLTYIPPKFKLHTHIINAYGMFENCFSNFTYDKVSLDDDYTYHDIIPTNGFTIVGDTNLTRSVAIDLRHLFYNCTHMTGTVSGTYLWNATYAENINSSGAFFNCKLLTNYNDIPNNWK